MEFHSFSHYPIFIVIFLPFQFIFSILYFFSLHHTPHSIVYSYSLGCPYSPSLLPLHSFLFLHTFNIGILAIRNTLLGDVVSSYLKRIYCFCSVYTKWNALWHTMLMGISITHSNSQRKFIFAFIIMHWNSYYGNGLGLEAYQPHNEQRLNEGIKANRLVPNSKNEQQQQQ